MNIVQKTRDRIVVQYNDKREVLYTITVPHEINPYIDSNGQYHADTETLTYVLESVSTATDIVFGIYYLA
jgi:hypothetical protein